MRPAIWASGALTRPMPPGRRQARKRRTVPGGTPPDQTQEKPKPKPSQAQLSRLQPYKGAERLDQRGGPRLGPTDGAPCADRRRTADAAAETPAPRRQAVRSARDQHRRSQAKALRRGGSSAGPPTRTGLPGRRRLRLPHVAGWLRPRFGLVAQRASWRTERRARPTISPIPPPMRLSPTASSTAASTSRAALSFDAEGRFALTTLTARPRSASAPTSASAPPALR